MGDRFNTIAGWALFAGIIALGSGIVSSKLSHSGRPEKMGYEIEGVEAEGGDAAAAGPGLNTLLASADVAAGEKVFAKCAACHTINQGGANGPVKLGVSGHIDVPHQLFFKGFMDPDIQGTAAGHQDIPAFFGFFHHLDDALDHG